MCEMTQSPQVAQDLMIALGCGRLCRDIAGQMSHPVGCDAGISH